MKFRKGSRFILLLARELCYRNTVKYKCDLFWLVGYNNILTYKCCLNLLNQTRIWLHLHNVSDKHYQDKWKIFLFTISKCKMDDNWSEIGKRDFLNKFTSTDSQKCLSSWTSTLSLQRSVVSWTSSFIITVQDNRTLHFLQARTISFMTMVWEFSHDLFSFLHQQKHMGCKVSKETENDEKKQKNRNIDNIQFSSKSLNEMSNKPIKFMGH